MVRPRAWTVAAAIGSTLLLLYAVTDRARIQLLADPRPALGAATFGFLGGLGLALAGSVGGFALGFLIGRGSRRPIAAALAAAEHRRAERFVARWGVLSVLVSRPVPAVAETVAVTSGAFGMPPVPALAAALAGGAVPAAAYAYAGWRGTSTAGGAVVFAVVAAAVGLCWVAGRRFTR